LVNVTGSFALGFFLTLGMDRFPVAITTPLTVGLLGGFTTFSTFAWESLSMFGDDRALHATGYVLASVLGGLLAASIGRALADSVL
jgi:CrcB protein